MIECRLQFGPYTLVPARDGRGIRHRYWVLPAVRHPLTNEWYSPVMSTADLDHRATLLGWAVELTFTEIEEI